MGDWTFQSPIPHHQLPIAIYFYPNESKRQFRRNEG